MSDYYSFWHDITDGEVLHCIKEWRMRRYGPKIEIPDSKKSPESDYQISA